MESLSIGLAAACAEAGEVLASIRAGQKKMESVACNSVADDLARGIGGLCNNQGQSCRVRRNESLKVGDGAVCPYNRREVEVVRYGSAHDLTLIVDAESGADVIFRERFELLHLPVRTGPQKRVERPEGHIRKLGMANRLAQVVQRAGWLPAHDPSPPRFPRS